jgi:alpha,alpha-trehalose phosphorylase
VNDNFYTNKLIAYQTAWINGLSTQLEEADSERWQSLKQKMILKDAELREFVRIGKSIALPFDDEKEIIAQDRDFLNKAYWPLSEKETHHPLLLHYHPLMIYRYQICKQADAVLAMMLFEEDFSEEIIQRSVEYYDRITTHDSSLSYSIFSVIYARLNQTDKAFEYFLKNALIDLEDTHGNTKDGIHAASIAGTYLTIINGFSHLKFDGNRPSINGTLPKQIQRLAYKINYLDKVYLIEMDQNNSKVTEIIADEELNQGVAE